MKAFENNAQTNKDIKPNADLKKFAQRSLSYWFEDGLLEIILGALFLLLGLTFLIEGIAQPGTPLRRVSGIAGMVLMVVGAWSARPIIRKLKERITYPRTGYVTYRKTTPTRKSRTRSYILILVISILVVGIITSAPDKILNWLPMLEGIILGGFLLFIGYRTLVYRFYILGTLSVLSGTILSVSGIGNLVGMGIFLLILGASLLLSGGYRFSTYLHRVSGSGDE